MYLLKLLIVLACYAWSGLGMLMMFMGGIFASTFAGWWQLLLLLWAAAAIAHIHLSLSWLEGRTLGRRTAMTGGVLGVAGFLAFPLLLVLSGRESLDARQVIQFVASESLALLPAFLLAIYVTWYHARQRPLNHRNSSNAESGNAA